MNRTREQVDPANGDHVIVKIYNNNGSSEWIDGIVESTENNLVNARLAPGRLPGGVNEISRIQVPTNSELLLLRREASSIDLEAQPINRPLLEVAHLSPPGDEDLGDDDFDL